MIAGHLREQNGYFQMVLSYKDKEGKRKTKSISTGLPVKGNKRRAEMMLLEARKNFELEQQPDEKKMPDKLLFSAFMLEWLEVVKTKVEATTYASYALSIKNRIVPYFEEREILLQNLTPKDIQD